MSSWRTSELVGIISMSMCSKGNWAKATPAQRRAPLPLSEGGQEDITEELPSEL